MVLRIRGKDNSTPSGISRHDKIDTIDQLIERDRGILTEHDRRYLLDRLTEDLSDNAEYQKRHKIRERIRNAILDFQIIQGRLEHRDIDQLFEPADEWAREVRVINEQRQTPYLPDFPLFIECWSAMIQFFVYSQLSTNIDESQLLARKVIERGVSRAIRQYGFDFTGEYFQADASLQWDVDRRLRLLNYVQHIENQMPNDPREIEEYLFRLYKFNYLPYHLVIYLHEKHVVGDANIS